MSLLENTDAIMSQLSSSFQHAAAQSHAHANPARQDAHPTHARTETRAEDRCILAHAQRQLQSHLAASREHAHPPTGPLQRSDSTWQQAPQPYPFPDHTPWQGDDERAPRHHFPAATHPPPSQWCEPARPSPPSSDSDAVRPSIEHADEPCIEGRPAARETQIKMEDASDDEPQTGWTGCVQHKESWVRRAGLKRALDESETLGAAKRGRVGV